MHISDTALRYFVTLAEELHFTRAAERLHITTPSLSQQIGRLEKRMGRTLFRRSPKAVQLTADGLALLPLAERAVDAHDAVLTWVGADQRSTALSVGIVASGAGEITSRILMTMVQRYPDVRLQLVRLGFFDALSAIEERKVDAALVLSPPPEGPGIVVTPLITEPRVLVVRADHPLAGRNSISIEETNDLDFVVPSAAEGPARSWWLVDPRRDGSHPHVAATADDVEGLMELCSAGVGVNIATRSVATHFGRPDLRYLEIVDAAPADVLLVRATQPRKEATIAFEQIALEITPNAWRETVFASPTESAP